MEKKVKFEDLVQEFDAHMIDWFISKDVTIGVSFQLIAHFLCAMASQYGYTDEEFAKSLEDLKRLLKIYRSKKVDYDNQPKTE